MSDIEAVVHMAGNPCQVGTRCRQRCSWCGALLLDYDLSRMGIDRIDETDIGIPTWPWGMLVAVEGVHSWLVQQPPDGRLPIGSCGLIDPDITGMSPDRP